ncbi:hypothetical protein ACVR1G_10010 [Streptococcus dentasini]
MLNSEKMIASIDQQDLEHANKYFKRALGEDDDETLLSLAQYLEGIGFLPQAKEIYLKERRDYPDVNINLAQIAAEDGQIEEAFLYLDTIDKNDDNYLSALLVMADLYDMEGLSDVAREKMLEARQLSDDPLVIFGLAELDYQLGNLQQAIREYAELDCRRTLEMTGVSTYQRIGHAYADMGEFEVAIEFLEMAVEIEYDDATVFELATLLYDQEEFQKANLYFKQLDTINPDFEGYEYIYALSLHEEHKIEEALKLAQQGLAKNDFDSQLLLLASQLSYENHDFQAAERYLLTAKDLAEDLEDVLMRLSNLYLEEERYEEVVDLEQEEIDNVLTKWNLAKAYQALEREEEALRYFEAIAEDLTDNPEFLQDYAYILREFGYRDRAYQVASRYLELVPDDLNMAEFLED